MPLTRKKNNKTAIVTGGAGFIGHHLVEKLIDNKWDVIILDDLSTGRNEWIHHRAAFINCDISKPIEIEIPDNAEAIYHLAAQARIQKSWDKPAYTYNVNVNGTRNVLDFAYKNNIEKVLLTSSNSVYGAWGLLKGEFRVTEDLSTKPLNPYAWHKVLLEQLGKMYADLFNMKIIVVRPFNVYGPDQQEDDAYCCVFPKFLQCKRENDFLPVYGDGKQTRDFTHVSDIVQAMYKLMKSKKTSNYEIVNLCTGISTPILEVAKMFEQRYRLLDNPRKAEMNWAWGSNKKLHDLALFKPQRKLDEYIKKYIY